LRRFYMRYRGINPLSQGFTDPLVLAPNFWQLAFENPALPVHIDVGSGTGEFILQRAEQEPTCNHLGLEIRSELVELSQKKKKENPSHLSNLYYLQTNASLSMDTILQSLPTPVVRVSILFPDPWWKKRHSKRRVVSSEFVDVLAQFLSPSSNIFLATDVQECKEYLQDLFKGTKYFEEEQHPESFWFPQQSRYESLRISVYKGVFTRTTIKHEKSS